MTVLESVRNLPLHEKLEIMEAIWDDLSADPDQVEIPDWHKEILQERADSEAAGKATYVDLETVRKQFLQRRA